MGGRSDLRRKSGRDDSESNRSFDVVSIDWVGGSSDLRRNSERDDTKSNRSFDVRSIDCMGSKSKSGRAGTGRRGGGGRRGGFGCIVRGGHFGVENPLHGLNSCKNALDKTEVIILGQREKGPKGKDYITKIL
mmetsp:Transcript_17438/g.37653  ORF Transcript_17438/g.37653 Transcript_17438/m.37653 type:complete len:133 (-) Transcript_17438:287-685(-)